MENKTYTQFERPEKKLEMPGGKSITERAGYVQPEKQIESFFRAGRLLNAARMEEYGGESEDEADVAYDPTTAPNYDLVDASEDMEALVAKKATADADSLKKKNESKMIQPDLIDPAKTTTLDKVEEPKK